MPQTTPPLIPPSKKDPPPRQRVTGSSGSDPNDGTGSNDGTGQLLQAGFWTFVVGVAAVFLIETVFGGIGVHGPHTNSGWLALIAALMCLPFGLLLLALGSAKWLRNRRIARAAAPHSSNHSTGS